MFARLSSSVVDHLRTRHEREGNNLKAQLVSRQKKHTKICNKSWKQKKAFNDTRGVIKSGIMN